MSDIVKLDNNTLEKVLMNDLSSLSSQQRVQYVTSVCNSLGLNPVTQPFDYITLNGKLTLYAKKSATEQLRKLYGVSVSIVSRETIDDVYVVTAKASTIDRSDESIGAVNIGGLKGDAKANAIMKAETKAKRRVTLSLLGLGILDETEVETINRASVTPLQRVQIPPAINKEPPAVPIERTIETREEDTKVSETTLAGMATSVEVIRPGGWDPHNDEHRGIVSKTLKELKLRPKSTDKQKLEELLLNADLASVPSLVKEYYGL